MNKKFKISLIIFGMLSVYLVAAVTNQVDKAAAKITTYSMYPGENKLVVDDSTGKSAGKKMVKIFFNNKDYTRFAEKLLNTNPLCFASSRLLIFGKKKMVLKKNQWRCKAGIIFIPSEKEILIINTSKITLDKDMQVLNIKSGKIKRISVDTNLETEKEEHELAMDFSKN